MNKKPFLLLAMIGLTTLSLAGCSKTIAVSDGQKITEHDYYAAAKTTAQGKRTFQELILNATLEKQYGKMISQAKVERQFKAYQQQYGDSFKTVLASQNLTEQSLKQQIRNNLLLQAAVKDHSNFSKTNLKQAWKNYQPPIKTKAILVDNADQAQGIIDKLKRSHGNKLTTFNRLAKANSANSLAKNKGTITVDNNQTTVPAEYQSVARQLKTGEYSTEPVKTDNGYYVIYILNHPRKGKLANHTAALKQQIVNDNLKNPRFMRKMTKQLLTDANIKIKDPAFKNALNDLTNNSK